MSGTCQSARGAAEDVDASRIRVVDAKHLSVGLGLVVEAAGEAIRTGATLDEVVATAEAAARNTRVYGAVRSLEFPVKGGRVNSNVAFVAGLIRLKPIVLFDEEGKGHTDGGHLGFRRAIRGMARRTAEFAGQDRVRLAITHADSPSGIAHLLEELRKWFGPDQDIPMTECGAVLATHTGLGALAVGVRRLRPDEGTSA
jgi:DegV family protein with EDD domain